MKGEECTGSYDGAWELDSNPEIYNDCETTMLISVEGIKKCETETFHSYFVPIGKNKVPLMG